MARTYSVTREQAASDLGISTRTIDRYIKGGKLSYKKVANKVLLAKEEIDGLRDDFSALHQESEMEVVSGGSSSTQRVTSISPSLEKAIEDKIDKFMLIFNEKDKIIEDKNKAIFMLQQRVGELENKLKSMVALPDYTREKQEALVEKQKLEEKIEQLQKENKMSKSKNFVFIGISLILIIVAAFFILTK